MDILGGVLTVEALQPGDEVHSSNLTRMASLCLYVEKYGKSNVEIAVAGSPWRRLAASVPLEVGHPEYIYRIKPRLLELWSIVPHEPELQPMSRRTLTEAIKVRDVTFKGEAKIFHMRATVKDFDV
jgi:hypothetical protein